MSDQPPPAPGTMFFPRRGASLAQAPGGHYVLSPSFLLPSPGLLCFPQPKFLLQPPHTYLNLSPPAFVISSSAVSSAPPGILISSLSLFLGKGRKQT